MGDTKIEWTDKTWNPVTGCTKVSQGCKHCYAERMAKRLQAMGQAHYQDGFKVTLHPDAVELPMRWRKPAKVFVNSMSDLFHEAVPFGFIDAVFATMAVTPWHTYQILTKRAGRMQEYFSDASRRIQEISSRFPELTDRHVLALPDVLTWPLPNVWLGVSAEDQANADKRIPLLLQTPAAVRFVSCEPLLGPVDLSEYLMCKMVSGPELDWPKGTILPEPDYPKPHAARLLPRLDLVIGGGESGPRSRHCDLAWLYRFVRQCREAGVRVFVKQLGAAWARANGAKDPKGGDWDEWPAELRVRELPGV